MISDCIGQPRQREVIRKKNQFRAQIAKGQHDQQEREPLSGSALQRWSPGFRRLVSHPAVPTM